MSRRANISICYHAEIDLDSFEPPAACVTDDAKLQHALAMVESDPARYRGNGAPIVNGRLADQLKMPY